jgi:hypothetical protein
VTFTTASAALAETLQTDVAALEAAHLVEQADTLAADLDGLATSNGSPWAVYRAAQAAAAADHEDSTVTAHATYIGARAGADEDRAVDSAGLLAALLNSRALTVQADGAAWASSGAALLSARTDVVNDLHTAGFHEPQLPQLSTPGSLSLQLAVSATAAGDYLPKFSVAAEDTDWLTLTTNLQDLLDEILAAHPDLDPLTGAYLTDEIFGDYLLNNLRRQPADPFHDPGLERFVRLPVRADIMASACSC